MTGLSQFWKVVVEFVYSVTSCKHHGLMLGEAWIVIILMFLALLIVQELCESRGGRPGLSVLTSLLVSVDVKNY